MTVVTSSQDTKTIELCQQFDVRCVITDAWYKRNSPCNKGAAMNVALQEMQPSGWLLSVDADIILLPPPSGLTPEFDPTCMYGARRRMCDEATRWSQCLRERDYIDLPMSSLPPVYAKRGKNGKRGKKKVWGHRPTCNPVGLQGYFQLWHYGSYPLRMQECIGANSYDVELGLKFSDDKRWLVPWPHYFVIHLGLPKVNWLGRKTEHWDMDPIPNGDLEMVAKSYYEFFRHDVK